MSTIFDVAKKAGVSIVTVSRLMNNPKVVSSRTAEKIFRVMESLHYQPNHIARSLVGKKTNTIGVIMPDIKNTFFNSWYRFIEEYANEQNINLLLCNTDDDAAKELKYVKLLHAQRVDGVIIAPYSKKSIEYLTSINMHFILFDRLFKGFKGDFVTTDHYRGAVEAVEYLLSLGHRKIAVLKGPGIIYSDTERYAAFTETMKKHRTNIYKEFVINCEFNEEIAFNATRELLLRKERPTVIFTFAGLMTKGAIKAIEDLHLSIPDDISLLGFDDIPGQDIFRPNITHVIQDISTLGKSVTLALLNTIKDPDSTERTRMSIKPTLVVGDSCKRLKS
ncbi:MAG: LacI family DNA-binding transcriptional regulator [Bacteroidota bacterium]